MTSPIEEDEAPSRSRAIVLLRRAYALTRQRPSPRVQRALLAVAGVLFVVGAWLSARTLDISADDIAWGPLAVAVLLVPVTMLANAEEYRISGRILGQSIGAVEALRITVFATAANLLPLPGAFVVKTQALQTRGSRTGEAAAATAIVGLAWIGVSLALAGLLLIPAGSAGVGAATGGVGLLVLGASHRWLRSQCDPDDAAPLLARLLVVEVGGVAVNALRLVLVLAALGIDADLVDAFVLAVSSSLASATGILPGGFGVREGIGAALGPLVGLPAAAGFISVAANRVLGFVVLAPISGLVALVLTPPAPTEPVTTSGHPAPTDPAEDAS